MDNKVIKRGRPKGAEQTVIILQERSSQKNPKVRKNIWSAVNLEFLDYIVCKSKGNLFI